LWTMLAHAQGTPLNASRLAINLSVSSPTAARYLGLLVDLLLVRRLQPFHANLGKRLVKAPKIYVRDSGVLHGLLAVPTRNALFDHPGVGASWEGFVIETLINCAPPGRRLSTTACRPALRSICCSNCPAPSFGRSKSSTACRPRSNADFTSPAMIFSPRAGWSSMLVQSACHCRMGSRRWGFSNWRCSWR